MKESNADVLDILEYVAIKKDGTIVENLIELSEPL